MSTRSLPRKFEWDKRLRFGRLITVALPGKLNGRARVLCECDCGKMKSIGTSDLTSGRTRSCGCLLSETARARATHGHNRVGLRTTEYIAWAGMVERCYRKNSIGYANYGGRGIAVCDRWRKSFETFLEDMGKKPSWAESIDRIDNDRGYEPENCRWTVRRVQNRNKRDCRMLRVGDFFGCIVEASERFGISEQTLASRLARGMSDEDAVRIPVASAGQRTYRGKV